MQKPREESSSRGEEGRGSPHLGQRFSLCGSGRRQKPDFGRLMDERVMGENTILRGFLRSESLRDPLQCVLFPSFPTKPHVPVPNEM